MDIFSLYMKPVSQKTFFKNKEYLSLQNLYGQVIYKIIKLKMKHMQILWVKNLSTPLIRHHSFCINDFNLDSNLGHKLLIIVYTS